MREMGYSKALKSKVGIKKRHLIKIVDIKSKKDDYFKTYCDEVVNLRSNLLCNNLVSNKKEFYQTF